MRMNMLKNYTFRGEIVWDKDFVFDERAQLHMLDLCRKARLNPKFEVSEGLPPVEFIAAVKEGSDRLVCWVREFKEWADNHLASGFPVPAPAAAKAVADFMTTNSTDRFGEVTCVAAHLLRAHLLRARICRAHLPRASAARKNIQYNRVCIFHARAPRRRTTQG